MIRHVIAGISTLLALWACVYMYNSDKEVNKLANIQSLIKRTEIKVHLVKKEKIKEEVQEGKSSIPQAKKQDKMADKLKALRDKAGNMAAFKVSPLYKKNCSSCHGTIGEGIIGPKLMGKSKDYILKNLKEFKAGTRKNYVMYGLLGNLSDQQLVDLANEISLFQEKLEKANK